MRLQICYDTSPKRKRVNFVGRGFTRLRFGLVLPIRMRAGLRQDLDADWIAGGEGVGGWIER